MNHDLPISYPIQKLLDELADASAHPTTAAGRLTAAIRATEPLSPSR